MKSLETELSNKSPILVSARSFEEYVGMFALSREDLSGSILDCGAGASNFSSEINRQGGDAKSVDPLYAQDIDMIRHAAMAGLERTNMNVRGNPDEYNWTMIPDADTHYAIRRSSAIAFLEDFKGGQGDTYIAGSLPALPFQDSSFDLTLCSYLLFTYADVLSADFHLSALREMLRVSSGEVRIYPVVGFGADAGPILSYSLMVLREEGVKAELVPVEYEFQKGGGAMLSLRHSG